MFRSRGASCLKCVCRVISYKTNLDLPYVNKPLFSAKLATVDCFKVLCMRAQCNTRYMAQNRGHRIPRLWSGQLTRIVCVQRKKTAPDYEQQNQIPKSTNTPHDQVSVYDDPVGDACCHGSAIIYDPRSRSQTGRVPREPLASRSDLLKGQFISFKDHLHISGDGLYVSTTG